MTRPYAQAARTSGQCVHRHDDAILEETSRRYEECHPDDTFADLVHRSSFSKEDRRLLEDWLGATAREVGGSNA